jgi:hypothetical protein
MPSELNFKIGDVATKIKWSGQQRELTIPSSYRPFMGSQSPDICLNLHPGNPAGGLGEKIFDGAPIWSLHRYEDGAAVKLFDQFSDIQRILVLAPEFARADLYFAEPDGRFVNPFFGPTIELMMINYLSRGHGCIIHACGIEHNGSGLMFAGESGAGKSTLAGIWDQQPGAQVLSDDRTIVRKDGDDFYIYGTPWHGEAKFGISRRAKLEKIFFLQHGRENEIQKINGMVAVQNLMTCSFPPLWDAKAMDFTLDFFSQIAAAVPCHELHFKPDKSAIDYIIENNE